jgi:diguanylate cyclase (GGDEF)-like protein
LSGITVDIPGRKEKEEKLLRKATLDALTGIANRGTFDAQLNNMQRSMEKSESSFSLLFLDVDDFKKVNDIWGHSVGDMALKHIAKILQSTLKNHDFVARIGGEEFAMLLHNISPDKSLRFAERICGLIESSPLIVPTGNIPLTVSIGLVHSASLSDEVTNEGMYQLADEALYQAKNSGRNMVVVYQ